MTGAQFRKIRIKLGMTQTQVAKSLGKSRRQIQNYENKKTEVPELVAREMKRIGDGARQTSEPCPAGDTGGVV